MFLSHSHSDGTHSLPLLRSFSTMSFLGELFLQLIHVQYSVEFCRHNKYWYASEFIYIEKYPHIYYLNTTLLHFHGEGRLVRITSEAFRRERVQVIGLVLI